jgi:hypothetical protein
VGSSRFAGRENLTVSLVEVPDGDRRVGNLVEILSEGVHAYLKHKGRGASNRRLGAPKIELTAGRDRAGIGTEGGVGSAHVTKASRALDKAKR